MRKEQFYGLQDINLTGVVGDAGSQLPKYADVYADPAQLQRNEIIMKQHYIKISKQRFINICSLVTLFLVCFGIGIGSGFISGKNHSTLLPPPASPVTTPVGGSEPTTTSYDEQPLVNTPNNKNNDDNNNNKESFTEPYIQMQQVLCSIEHYSVVCAELENPNSYQTKSLEWLINNKHYNEYSIQQKLQRYVLACIYHSTNSVVNKFTGAKAPVQPWITSKNWLTDTDECSDWFGITCETDGNAFSGVSNIQLLNNGLSGIFPPEVSLLRDTLRIIDISNNTIANKGDEEHDFLGKLFLLEDWDHDNNFFSYDGIPSVIATLTNLKRYDCGSNYYGGPLDPTIFGELSKLTYLDISRNPFKPIEIPTQITQLTALTSLYLSHTNVISQNLNFLSNLKQIENFWIGGNEDVSGEIPTFIGSLNTKLQEFGAEECNLSGSIPSEIGLLSNSLINIWLYDNELHKNIPTELGLLTKLQFIDISDNEITGTMPNEICQLRTASDNDSGGVLEELITDCEADKGNRIATKPKVTCNVDTCCTECAQD